MSNAKTASGNGIATVGKSGNILDVWFPNPTLGALSNNQQNLWTEIAPQAMLYGALLQAQPYLKALDKIPVWKQFYTDAVTALKREDDARRIDRNTTIQEP